MKWPWQKPAPAPAPAPKLTTADASVLNRAGLKLPEWEDMSDSERADLRYRLGIA